MSGWILHQQFVGVGDEVKKGVEVSLIFPFVKPVEEGAFFGAALVFFFLFEEQFGGEDFTTEVAVIKIGIVDTFIEDLQLRDREALGEQFEEDRVQGGLIAELAFGDVDHASMIKDEVGHFFQVEPFGVVIGGQLAGVLVDVDQGEVGDADGTFDWVAVGFTEGFHLFQVHAFEAGQFFEDAVCGLVEAFIGLQEASHEGPVPSHGLKSALDQQEFDIASVKSEDNAVDCYERTGFAWVFIHVCCR